MIYTKDNIEGVRFKTLSNKDQIYFIQIVNKDDCLVVWEDNKERSVLYIINNIINYFNNKDWIPVEPKIIEDFPIF